MRVFVRMQAQVRQAAGTASSTVAVPEGATVADVVRALAAEHGDDLRRLLLVGDRVQPTLLLFKGDEQVGPNDPLTDGDELTVLAPMAGG